MVTGTQARIPGTEQTYEQQVDIEIARLSKENGELEDKRAAYNDRIDERIAQNDRLMELLRRSKDR